MKDSKKVAIYSANLIEVDWEERTQIIWMSPLLPRLEKNESKDFDEKNESENFKSDLLNYISSYNLSQLEKIKEEIETFDFSQVKIRLVASIPGKGIFKLHFFLARSWLPRRCTA